MIESTTLSIHLKDFSLWEKAKGKRVPFAFDLEITARCNNNCRHCYINLDANNKEARKDELSLNEIKKIVDEAVSLGAFWCLLTGGEPLLRGDFFDIYLYLKKKGLLVSVFTNATLITKQHIQFFKKYPPRNIEVSVYGISQETYERISRKPGSFNAYNRGLNLLFNGDIQVRLKAMAMRSNVHELKEISRFCWEKTADYFRFDPFLHLRFDRNQERNKEIRAERLFPDEIVTIERADSLRFNSLKKSCEKLIVQEFYPKVCNHLFHCGAGNSSFAISYDGIFRLCSPLWHPDTLYDLKKGCLTYAWHKFVPKVRDMRSHNKNYLEKCRSCQLINLCMWCPAKSFLETGHMDTPVDYFCKIANARAEALKI